MTESGERFAVQLDGGREAAARARRAVLARNGRLPDAVRDDVLLLVSELVTNAVRHAGVGPEEGLELEFEMSPRHVRVEVADPGKGFDRDVVSPLPRDVGGGACAWWISSPMPGESGRPSPAPACGSRSASATWAGSASAFPDRIALQAAPVEERAEGAGEHRDHGDRPGLKEHVQYTRGRGDRVGQLRRHGQ